MSTTHRASPERTDKARKDDAKTSSQPRPERKIGMSMLRKNLWNIERGWSVTTGFLVLMVLVPFVSAGSIPTMTAGLLMLTMCYAWNLVGGFLGEFSFVHMVFWGVGSYGIVMVINDSQPVLPWFVALTIVGVLCGLAVAVLIRMVGLPGPLSLAIFTVVLGEIALSYAEGSDRLGGVEGLIALGLPSFTPEQMFLILVGLTAAAAYFNVTASNTRMGREWLAIRDDPTAALVAGINVEARRRLAYMVSAGFFALGGAYQAYYSGFALPEVALGMLQLILVSLAVFIGGPGTPLGPLVGWIIIFGLDAIAQQVSSDANASLYGQLLEFGVALLLIRLVLPRLKGLPLATALARLPQRRTRSARAVSTSGVADVASAVAMPEVDDADILHDRPASSSLEIRDVTKSFGALKVLRGVSFSIAPGEVVGIVGPNGAGKSTLCNLISGVENVTSGTIALDGTDITHVPTRKRSAIGVGRSFQAPRLFESLSLAENLMLADRHMSEADADRILQRLGINDSLRRRGDDSQFLARRLTEVRKASVHSSSMLVLDEPLAGLTSDEHSMVLAMARQAADAGACVAIVEHLIPVLAPAVDRIVVLFEGRIIADGPPAEVLQDEAVIDAYLGAPIQLEEQS